MLLQFGVLSDVVKSVFMRIHYVYASCCRNVFVFQLFTSFLGVCFIYITFEYCCLINMFVIYPRVHNCSSHMR